jgi:hypothetical protein
VQAPRVEMVGRVGDEDLGYWLVSR